MEAGKYCSYIDSLKEEKGLLKSYNAPINGMTHHMPLRNMFIFD